MSPRRSRSTVRRLPSEQRKYVERLLREDRLTLDEMIADLQARWPGQPAADISRTALHRYDKQVAELTARMRDIDTAARVVIEELGESSDDKAGALLMQSITTLATHAALNAQKGDGISIDEVRKLARAAKDVMGARKTGLAERQALEKAAREKLLVEQKGNLEQVASELGMDQAQVEFWQKRFLGMH